MNDYSPAVVGTDTDIELREGHAKFNFIFCNKPVIRHGEERIHPEHGDATAWMTDGIWSVHTVYIAGYHAKKDGSGPTKRKAHVRYSFGFMPPVEEGETYHPDYAPPQWLVDFVAAFEDRLSGRKGNRDV